MTNKVKLNAAEVIKHMSEKELKQYNISLEKKDGKGSPTLSDIYNFMQFFYREFKEFKTYVLKKFDNYDQLFKEHGWIK